MNLEDHYDCVPAQDFTIIDKSCSHCTIECCSLLRFSLLTFISCPFTFTLSLLVLKQRERGSDLEILETEETGGVDDGGLDAIVAKLRSTMPQRMKGGANIRPLSRPKEDDQELEEEMGRMGDGGLGAIVAKLRSTAPQRMKGAAHVKPRVRQEELPNEEDQDDEDAEDSDDDDDGEDDDEKDSSVSRAHGETPASNTRTYNESKNTSNEKKAASKKKTERTRRLQSQKSSEVSDSENTTVGQSHLRYHSSAADSRQSESSSVEDSDGEPQEKVTGFQGGDDDEDDFLVVKKNDVFGIKEEEPVRNGCNTFIPLQKKDFKLIRLN